MPWIAVYTKPRWEKKIAKIINEKGIECYCPTQKVLSQWKDRKAYVQKVVIPGYLFVQANKNEYPLLLKIDGILNFVYYNKKIAEISDKEMGLFKKFTSENENFEVKRFDVGELVKIASGTFRNQQAMIIRINKNRAKLMLTTLGLVIEADLRKILIE